LLYENDNDGNGKDTHRIREKDILRFIRTHPQEISLGKVDPMWFLDLVLLRGREVQESPLRLSHTMPKQQTLHSERSAPNTTPVV
jgi:hypothetical protein